jgi:hypothetical protein
MPANEITPGGMPGAAEQGNFLLEIYYHGIYTIKYFVLKIYLYINTIAGVVLSRKI